MAEKLYNDVEYAQKAIQATEEGKFLYILRHDVEYDVEVYEWNYEEHTEERQKIDEDGNPMYDKDGDPIMETITVRVRTTPIMVEEEIVDPETGKKIKVMVQKHHTEVQTKTVDELMIAAEGQYILIEENITDGTVNPDYDEVAIREAKFKREFFLVEGIKKKVNGYYRKKPEGYASAIESLNAAYVIAKEQGVIPAGTLVFYEEPDFNEDITEEWLVAHQIVLDEMDFAAFMSLYAKFIMAWNTQEHVK